MPLELGTTIITGRLPNFTLLPNPPGTVLSSSEREDEITAKYVSALKNVGNWVTDKKNEINKKHKKNMQTIDAENDEDIKAEGGLNTHLDITTPSQTIKKEKIF